jgi:hypothetical protein
MDGKIIPKVVLEWKPTGRRIRGRPRRRWIEDHHTHQGLGHLACSVSRVAAALASVSSVSQLFFFPVDCSGMILKGFGFVAFFAGVKASSFCIHLSIYPVQYTFSLQFAACGVVCFIVISPVYTYAPTSRIWLFGPDCRAGPWCRIVVPARDTKSSQYWPARQTCRFGSCSPICIGFGAARGVSTELETLTATCTM